MYNLSLPLFSKEYNKTNRKAKMVRMVLIPGGPIQKEGVRYKNMGDRWSE
jgi:hypothetical protein